MACWGNASLGLGQHMVKDEGGEVIRVHFVKGLECQREECALDLCVNSSGSKG